MRDRPSPPHYNHGPEAYDPYFDGPWEEYQGRARHQRFTIGDVWWGAFLAVFLFLSVRLGLDGGPIGLLLLEASKAAVVALCVALWVQIIRRIRGA